MSVMINNVTQDIQITRGDSFSFVLKDKATGLPYVFGSTDVITFTVRKTVGGEVEIEILGEHDINNNVTINITPENTDTLDYGIYLYDIQWAKTNGWAKTIIPTNPLQLPQFNICQEITRAEVV